MSAEGRRLVAAPAGAAPALSPAAAADARWEALKSYLDASVRSLRAEAAEWADAGHDEMALRLRRNAEVLGMVQVHMGDTEDEMAAGAAAKENDRG